MRISDWLEEISNRYEPEIDMYAKLQATVEATKANLPMTLQPSEYKVIRSVHLLPLGNWKVFKPTCLFNINVMNVMSLVDSEINPDSPWLGTFDSANDAHGETLISASTPNLARFICTNSDVN